MPEYPDIENYLEAFETHVVGQTLEKVRVVGPNLLKTYDPPVSDFAGLVLRGTKRIGKRIALRFDHDMWLVMHLMISGRLRWKEKGAKLPAKVGQALFEFTEGTLLFTEASSHKRASLYAVRGAERLADFDPGGLEVMTATASEFKRRMQEHRHTLKRAMTDPKILSGIGNAYSDEILHRARLSPMRRTDQVSEEDYTRLFEATRSVLREWTDLLRKKNKGKFPDKVTAFHKEMAVHGKYEQPCPDCGKPVQRIRYANNECNYCAECQMGGKLLADRALSRLLKDDWPTTLEELEDMKEENRRKG